MKDSEEAHEDRPGVPQNNIVFLANWAFPHIQPANVMTRARRVHAMHTGPAHQRAIARMSANCFHQFWRAPWHKVAKRLARLVIQISIPCLSFLSPVNHRNGVCGSYMGLLLYGAYRKWAHPACLIVFGPTLIAWLHILGPSYARQQAPGLPVLYAITAHPDGECHYPGPPMAISAMSKAHHCVRNSRMGPCYSADITRAHAEGGSHWPGPLVAVVTSAVACPYRALTGAGPNTCVKFPAHLPTYLRRMGPSKPLAVVRADCLQTYITWAHPHRRYRSMGLPVHSDTGAKPIRETNVGPPMDEMAVYLLVFGHSCMDVPMALPT
ncbi:uncharacterized protein F5891DRAFT_979682 [Suillus fuscotomentosus]|uniref:Uncharacterized protein n=1 Tax=Suillus fuscotomentosus TaxID=1912939 RepID=A0AAD4HKL4_9AGAM|nr:uncharacterized protein F5891DRAFT_979682 [Suillus fuscotomentosus]KAG1901125.1 hypothetical protein F5891DRAFT_979682 [Suillus fuscotomentosus]